MNDETQGGAVQTDENRISNEDALIAVEIIKKALEQRDFIKEGLFGDKFMALSRDQRLAEFVTPRISKIYIDDERKIPMLFLRITGDEGPLTDATFYPLEAVWSFLEEARGFIRRNRPADMTDEGFEQMAFRYALEMTLIMFDNVYARVKLMMDSFTWETIVQWHSQFTNDFAQYRSESGEKVVRPKESFMDKALKIYSLEVKRMWRYQGQGRENFRKLVFVDEYETLFRHWKRLAGMVSKGDEDWQDYAKAGKFDDTPEDLLKNLHNLNRSSATAEKNRISELALEHAARRVGLIKRHGVSEWALKKRRNGIKISDYSSVQLYTYLQEGKVHKITVERNKEIQTQIATYPVPEEDTTAVMEKNRDLLKQKIDFIKENLSSEAEPKAEIAMEKKA